jgi:hypothetical protein
VVAAENMASSHLYSDTYTHLFRQASTRARTGAARGRSDGKA